MCRTNRTKEGVSMIEFTEEELEALLRKHREFEELLGRIIRDKKAKHCFFHGTFTEDHCPECRMSQYKKVEL
jgi:hypothetical protein